MENTPNNYSYYFLLFLENFYEDFVGQYRQPITKKSIHQYVRDLRLRSLPDDSPEEIFRKQKITAKDVLEKQAIKTTKTDIRLHR